MEIRLLDVDKKETIKKLYTACRTCYNAGTPTDMWIELMELPISEERMLKLINRVISSGHHSVLEHVQLTFLISGVSRALTHQLVRHRIGVAISQQSQRYCTFEGGKFDYVIPNMIKGNSYACNLFEGTMEHLAGVYDKLIQAGIPAEDARAVLPNACCTNLTWSVNIRELMHVCNERLCSCAQSEIRVMTQKIRLATIAQLPFLKPYLVPKCEILGYCNESKQRSCGRKKVKEVVIPKEEYVLSGE